MTNVSPDETMDALRALAVPDDLAQRHLARIEAARHEAVVVPIRRHHALRATAAGIVVGATLISGVGVAAASTARPGDALYGVKTAREHLQLSMTRHGESRARLELRLARTRLAEAAELLRDGDIAGGVATLARADAALASAAAQGSDAIDADVAVELDHRVEVLSSLLDGGLPDTAADAAREAVERALQRGAHPAPAHGKPDSPGKPSPTDHPGHGNHPGHPNGRPSTPPGHTH